MTFAIFLTIGIAAGLILFAWPKLGSMLIWPILFMYPHNWWYHNGFLPLNIGADDLFCVLLFLVVAIRRNLFAEVEIRMGYAFWVITAFTVISAVSNVVGVYETGGDTARQEAIKGTLKPMIFWGLFVSILHCIDNTKDLKNQFAFFSLAAALGGTLVILQSFFPHEFNIFAQPRPFRYTSGVTFEGRGAGAFMNPNAAACVMGCSILIAITALRLQARWVGKFMIYAIMIVLMVGLFYTRSRTGLIATTICLVVMAFVGRSKRVAWVVLAGGAVVVLAMVTARGLVSERFTEAYNPETGAIGSNIAGRIETWVVYLKESSPRNYLLGQGSAAAVTKHGMESHNAYISLLTVYGIGGTIWLLCTWTGFIRRVWASLRSADPILKTVGAGALWVMFFWSMYAMTSDAISSYYSRFLFFYVVVLIDRSFVFARQSVPDDAVSGSAVADFLTPTEASIAYAGRP